MSITKSIEFYAGKKNILKKDFFGCSFLDYEFTKDIAYKDISFNEVATEMKKFMKKNNIKIAYCDISCDFGGGYSLQKRYTFFNENGNYITEKQKYGWC